ncbi:peptidase A4 family-domain-containing protein [Mycena galericulata]|nr:peptidase A4 family-domain-containing protein [Mycena galericulata]
MLFSALFVQTLVVAGALAAPSPDNRSQDRIGRREEFIRRATPPGAVPFHSSNWAGAVITDPTAKWQSVSGQFVVPAFGAPLGLRAAYISIWVAVDGFTCNTATVKAGVDIEVINDAPSYFAWDEYFPGQYNAETNSIFFSAGNTVNLIAIANISNLQEAEIQNLSAHVSVGRAFAPGPALCQSDVIWGIETWEVGDIREPFSVEFTNAQATRSDGTVVGPGEATVINTQENGSVLSSCSTTASTVTCSFPQP